MIKILIAISCITMTLSNAMEESPNKASIKKIVIKKYSEENKFFDMIKTHVEPPISIRFIGNLIFSYVDNNKKAEIYQPNHVMYVGYNPILTVYVCTDTNEQNVFMGSPKGFFEDNQFITQPVTLAIALLQTSKENFKFTPQKKMNVEELFSEVSTKLNVTNLKQYWLASPPNKYPQSSAVILKPENKSYLLLQDGQMINFHDS